MTLQWLTSPEWANVVESLLHTLWLGAVIALLLGLVLRCCDRPVVRYRCSLTALCSVVLAGLITWAVLNRPVSPPVFDAPVSQKISVTAPALKNNSPALTVNFPPPELKPVPWSWTAWLGLLWLAGAMAMIIRVGIQVAGAEKLRRAARPLDEVYIVKLLADARQSVGLVRRVRLAITERLTSPAVIGVWLPTIILPLSLTTTLTPEQIRFVLLHELAHIRRGDYFASLFQLFVEALLFFNPAVWWISRQMRNEREACCDELAIELSGAPVDYARTLVQVAEKVLSPVPAAVPAFGDRREPSSLADRVQRLLVPGYRPQLRLTWRAMLAALVAGGGLLFFSALGTRVAIAAILSPQQRIARIEQKMTEYGQPPVAATFNHNQGEIKVSGRVRLADGSAVPKWMDIYINSKANSSSVSMVTDAKDGLFTNQIWAGMIYISAEVTNYAPAQIGPLDGLSTNSFENLELVCGHGFDVPLQVVDKDSGNTLTNATVTTVLSLNTGSYSPHLWKSGTGGAITLTHCADLPLNVTVNVPGYEIVVKQFDHVRPGEPLRVALHRGAILSGTILYRITGQPVAGGRCGIASALSSGWRRFRSILSVGQFALWIGEKHC